MNHESDDASEPASTNPVDPIRVRYLWDPDTAVEAFRVHGRTSKWRWVRILVGVALLVFYLPATVFTPLMIAFKDGLDSSAGQISLGIATLFLCFWVWLFVAIRKGTRLRRQVRKAFQSSAMGPHITEWEISPGELVSRTPITASTVHWPLFIKAVEAPEGYLLYQNANFFNYIPARGFRSESDLQRFGDLARERIREFRVLGPAQFVGKPTAGFEDL